MKETETIKTLGVADLLVFGGIILVAVIFGIYYAVVERKNVDNYYFGGKKMPPIPVGLSISVTLISAITVIGLPTEVYSYGTNIIWFAVMNSVPVFVACVYYIPAIHRLQLRSINQYLELRFHKLLRQFSSAIAVFTQVFYLGMTIYLPALALDAVTPLNLITTISLIAVVCTFYTTLGGMKAVVWTDTVQTVAMVTGGVAALIKTTLIVGGFGIIYQAVDRGGRLNVFNFNPDPTIRYTFWSYFIGYSIGWCKVFCVSQEVVQRYLSCSSVRNARIAAVVSLIPSFFLMVIATLSGAAMYAYYEGCDPIESGKITKPDQMMPYLVMEIFEDTPGMAGLFVAAAFSGTLSTVSSGINSMSALILEDFILSRKPCLNEINKLIISKVTAVGLGVVVLGFATLVSTIDATAVRMTMSIGGALGGPILGVFTLGFFFPWATSLGAAIGQIFGTIFNCWIAIGSLLNGRSAPANRPLPVSTANCSNILQETWMGNSTTVSTFDASTVFSETFQNSSNIDDQSASIATTLYAISYFYYGFLSLVSTVMFGLLASFITGANDSSQADPKLFIPLVDNQLFPKRVKKFFRFGVPLMEISGDSKSPRNEYLEECLPLEDTAYKEL